MLLRVGASYAGAVAVVALHVGLIALAAAVVFFAVWGFGAAAVVVAVAVLVVGRSARRGFVVCNKARCCGRWTAGPSRRRGTRGRRVP